MYPLTLSHHASGTPNVPYNPVPVTLSPCSSSLPIVLSHLSLVNSSALEAQAFKP